MAKSKTPTNTLETKDLDNIAELITHVDDVVDIIDMLDQDDSSKSHIMYELGRCVVKLRTVYNNLQDLQDKYDHRITSFSDDI